MAFKPNNFSDITRNASCGGIDMKEIKRGDIYYADLSPVIGSEQGGMRPVLIVQNDVGNHYSPTVIIAVLTSKIKKKMPTHIAIKNGEANIMMDSIILLEQLRTIDKFRLAKYIGSISDEKMRQVDQAMLISLGLNNFLQREMQKIS